MPVRCGVCAHPQRVDIDADLLGVGDRGKVTQAQVCQRYGLGRGQVQRHVGRGHIAAVMTAVKGQVTEFQGANLLIKLGELYEKADRLMGKAEQADDLRTAVAAVGQARAVIETFAKVGIALAQGDEHAGQEQAGSGVDDAITEQLRRRQERLAIEAPTSSDPDDEVAEAEIVDTLDS